MNIVARAGAAAGINGNAEPGPYVIQASSGLRDDRKRVIRHGDTFAVFDHYGDIRNGGLGDEGIYHLGTRHLSYLELELETRRPFFLHSTVPDANDVLSVALTNPDLYERNRDKVRVRMGTLYIGVKKFLWKGALYQEFLVKNHGLQPIDTWLALRYAADFADIFEVRGMTRPQRGEDLEPAVGDSSVLLGYFGLDNVERRTSIEFSTPPSRIARGRAVVELSLAPQEETSFCVTIVCRRDLQPPATMSVEHARAEILTERERAASAACHIESSSGRFNLWTRRAVADVQMMTTDLSTGPYPYAGVPWFDTPFGRDAIITAFECLWMNSALARGVLSFLAATQAKHVDDWQDSEPGKILHETRASEMAALREVPFGRYYGSVDATPLFIVLAGAYLERTNDLAFIESIWPNVEAALAWIDHYGDRDGDGFVEYDRRGERGLRHQGWKDSDDSVFHADGTLAEPPIALCEVQAYVYAARVAAAKIALATGLSQRHNELYQQAELLRHQFERVFWSEDLGTYVLALDRDKRPCAVRTSNAGQCLFTGIVSPQRASVLANTLLAPESFSGWGIRTVAATEARYNPVSYHNGTIWPHDNALIAYGLARYGLREQALHVLWSQYEAALRFDLQRMPELFCGFPLQPEEAPVPYPVACAPQSWSAASVLLLLQATLGLEIDAAESVVRFARPRLPSPVNELRIQNLAVGDAAVDLRIINYPEGANVNVLRRRGDVEIAIVQ